MGKQEQHKITGIARNLPPSVVGDFSCAEVINMRCKDGVWRPVGDKKKESGEKSVVISRSANVFFLHTTGITRQMIFFHTVSTLGGNIQRISYYGYPKPSGASDTSNVILSFQEGESRKVRFNAVGNILVIFVEEGENGEAPYMKYAMWWADDKKYILLPNLPVPNPKIGVSNGVIKVCFDNSDNFEFNYGLLGYGLVMFAYKTYTGHLILSSAVCLINYRAVRDYTLDGGEIYNGGRLFFGSTYNDFVPEMWENIIYSIDVYVTYPEDNIGSIGLEKYLNESIFYKVYEITKEQEYFGRTSIIYGNGVLYPINDVALNNFLSFYKNDINPSSEGTGQIFIKKDDTPLRMIFDFYFEHSSRRNPPPFNLTLTGPVTFQLSSSYGFEKEIIITAAGTYRLEVNGYSNIDIPNKNYLLGTITYQSVDKSSNGLNVSINIPVKDVISTKTSLELPIVHNIYGNCDFVYNSRLFLGDTTRILFKGYSLDDYFSSYPYDKNGAYTVYFVTYLKIKNEKKIVVSSPSKGKIELTDNGLNIRFPTLLCYPDVGAYKIELYIGYNGKTYKAEEFKLIQSRKNNFAYCVMYKYSNRDLAGAHGDGYANFGSSDKVLNFNVRSNGIPDYPEVPLPENENVVKSTNNVSASVLALPMVYPNDHSYIVGDKKIVGLSANNISIDASNFGMFPVFAFTEGGIYAMELGRDGETLVQRIVPLSGDVCINKESITNIGGATLFASKDGLRVLQGQRSEKITSPLEFYEGNLLREATLKNGHSALDAILNKHKLAGYVDSVDFNTYLAGAKCYFHYKENEVVITNKAYPYSYVYSLNTRMYYKVAERYYHVFSDYPNAYGTDSAGSVIYNLGEEVTPAGGRQNVFVQTNPFKLSTDGFEMIRRIFTRFGWSAAPAGSVISIYLFVSNDTRKWAWVDACEITAAKAPNGAQNFSPLRCPASVKYGMLVIAGDMGAVSDYITHISVEYQQRYGNKLR
jgi:hypothetical protein